jgi:hypothetical protein
MPSDSSNVCDPNDNPDDQDETSVAINRINKSVICIGSNEGGDDGGMYTNGMPVYTSTDEGASWRTYHLPQPPTTSGNTDFVALGDPILTSDDRGNFYYAYLGGDGSNSTGNICIAMSSDGVNWSNRTPIDINKSIPGSADKEHMTVDCSTSSPYYKRVYVTWYEFYVNGLQTGEGLCLAWSDDGCKTWSNPVRLGQGDNFQEIKTNSRGDILLAFSDSQTLGQELFVSTDGGKTFTKNGIRMNHQLSLFPVNRNGEQALKGGNGFRSFPYIVFDVDLSIDRIHAIYGNYELTTGRRNAVLYYVTSDNNGISWTAPKMLGSANPAFDRFHPWLSFDQSTGTVWGMYYSSEADPNNILSAAYRIRLTANLTYGPEMLHPLFDPTTVETSALSSFPFIGDYNGSDAFDSVYVATWTENHPNATDGETFAYISKNMGVEGVNAVSEPIVIHADHLWASYPYPNPLVGTTFSMSYYLPRETHLSIQLTDANGKLVKMLSDKNTGAGTFTEQFSLGQVAAGTYFIELISDTGHQMRKIVVQ